MRRKLKRRGATLIIGLVLGLGCVYAPLYAQESPAQQPAAQQPAANEEPAAQQPAANEEPAAQQPAANEEPAAQQPAANKEPAAQQSNDQRVVIKGVVLDENNEPLIGASVSVKGMLTGTKANAEGGFALSLSPSAVLVVTYVGYATQEVSVAGKTDLTVKMKPKEKTANEVVVIGYGTAKRYDVNTAISSVKISDVEQGADYDPLKMLQGRATGVNVVVPSGTPGDRPQILIRGAASVSGNGQPLYVVDGVPNERYPYINPNDIDAIDVLKDAAAAAIYGSRGTSGVVIITTKSGKKGRTTVQYDGRVGFGLIAKDIPMANSAEYEKVMQKALDNYNAQKGLTGTNALTLYKPANPSETDWVKAISRDYAISTSHNVSISGGNDNTLYFSSLAYNLQEGILKTTGQQQVNYRLNLSHKFSEIFKLTSNLSLSFTKIDKTEEASTGLKTLRTAREEQPWFAPYDANGNYTVNTSGSIIRHNPVMLINEEKWYETRTEGSLTLSLDVTPFEYTFLKGLKYTPSVRLFGQLVDDKKTITEKHVRSGDANWGAVDQSRGEGLRYVIENILSYDNKFSDFSLNLMAGHTFESYFYEGFGARSANYSTTAQGGYPSSSFGLINAGPNIYASGVGYNAYTLESYIGRLGLGYGGRYMLNAVVRVDGSSKFSPGNRYGTFPSVSLAWRISEEEFMKQISDVISNFKIRASWGLTGNIQGINNFASQTLVSAAGKSYNNNGGSGLSQVGQNVTWEKASQFNVGLEMSFLQGALSFGADFFHQNVSDMLYNKPVQATSGYTSLPANIGTMTNLGVEFSVQGRMQFDEVSWTLGGDLSWVQNELTSLIGGVDVYTLSSPAGVVNPPPHALVIGKPVSAWYMLEQLGIYQYDADVPQKLKDKGVRAGDVMYKDENGDGDITDADRVYAGKATPDFFGGINSSLAWRGFELNIFCQFSVGAKILAAYRGSGTEGTDHLGGASRNREGDVATETSFFNIRRDVAYGYWDGPGTSNTTPRPILSAAHTGYTYGYNTQTSTRFLEDASYFRIKTITLAYNLPEDWLLASNLIRGIRIYFSVDNVATVTGYSGYNPEQSYSDGPGSNGYGVDYGLQPFLRSFIVGLNLKF